MKKILILFLIPVLFVSLSSCSKEEHKVRIRNEFQETIYSIVAGNAEIGPVLQGETSGYVPINAGNFTMSGVTASGLQLTGEGMVKGKGKYYWTISVNSGGIINIEEDD